MVEYCNNDWPLFDENSSETLADLQNFRQAYEPVHGYLCLGICSWGVVTNLMHIVVLTRPSMRHSAVNVILTAIAACDTGTMASYLIYISHFVLSRPQDLCTPYFYTYSWMVFLMWHSASSIALHSAGLWLSVAMAFVRRMTLRQTTIHSKWQTAEHAWKICVFVYVGIFVLCIPTALSHEIQEIPHYFDYFCDNGTEFEKNFKTYTINAPELALKYDCRLYKLNLWLIGLAFKVIPCLLLGFLSTSLLIRLREAERKHRRLQAEVSGGSREAGNINTRSQQTDRTTILLISILLVFLITELPQGTLTIMNAISTRDVTTYIYRNFGDILDLLSLINSCVNFILYCIMSSKYRKTFWKVILPQSFYIRHFASNVGDLASHDAVTRTNQFSQIAERVNNRSFRQLLRPVTRSQTINQPLLESCQ